VMLVRPALNGVNYQFLRLSACSVDFESPHYEVNVQSVHSEIFESFWHFQCSKSLVCSEIAKRLKSARQSRDEYGRR
jgi:hypothetical protein